MNRAAFDDLLAACRRILAAEYRPSELRDDHVAAIAAVRAAVEKAKGEPVPGADITDFSDEAKCLA